MTIQSVLCSFHFARVGFPLTAILFAAGCASSPVTEHVEGKEVTVQIPMRTAVVFSRGDAIALTRRYAESLRLPLDLETKATGIIDKNFSQLPETTRSGIVASAGQSRLVCTNLESVLNKLLVPDQLYTHKNSWTHDSIRPKTSGGSSVTMCQGDGPFPTSATLIARFTKEWWWGCRGCDANSFVELTLPTRFEHVPQTSTGEEQLRITFKVESVKDKTPRTAMGNAVADTHFDMSGFFAALGQIPSEYPRQGLEPENPYAKAIAQTKQDLVTLADDWRQKVANEQKTTKEATLTRWRATVKTGDEGWIGPFSFGQLAKNLMLHALVVERRSGLVRVQYDGKTDHDMAINLRDKEAWVKVEAFFPEGDYSTGRPLSILEPRAMPTLR